MHIKPVFLIVCRRVEAEKVRLGRGLCSLAQEPPATWCQEASWIVLR